MPPAKFKSEDLIDALADPRVTQAIRAALMLAIRECLTLIVKEEMSLFAAMQQKIVDEQTQQKKLIDDLKEMNAVLQKRIDFLDVDSRLSSHIIRGLPEVSYAEKAAPSTDHRFNMTWDHRRTCSRLTSLQRNERSLLCVMMTSAST